MKMRKKRKGKREREEMDRYNFVGGSAGDRGVGRADISFPVAYYCKGRGRVGGEVGDKNV